MIDIERGPISRLEKILAVWRRLLLQKRNLFFLGTLWFVLLLFLYKVPERLIQYAEAVNTTAVVEVLRDQLPEHTPEPPSDALERLQFVQTHVESYDGVETTPYEFNSRLRNDIDLDTISQSLSQVMLANEFYCAAAPHIGHAKHIMKIGKTIYVNSQLLGVEPETVDIAEESAFYPDFRSTKQRYETIELRYFDRYGTQQRDVLSGMDSICAQHLLDTLNGIKFKLADEL